MRTSTTSRMTAALLVVLSVLGVLVVAAPAAGAAAAPVALLRVQPLSDDGRTFLAGREAARVAGQPDLFKIKGDAWFKNNGTSDLRVGSTEISYPGSSVAPTTTSPTTTEVLPAGGEGRVRVFDGIKRQLPEPLPPSVRVVVNFVTNESPGSLVGTAEFTYALAFARNDTATGGHAFPGLASDLKAGEYWYYRSRHIDDATGFQQPSTVADRYAYDLGVVRWDGERYSLVGVDSEGNSLSGTENSHWLVFGKPLYAVGAGQVVQCSRGNPDNSRPEVEDAGLNELWIQFGDDLMRYAHLKADSIPARLCPNGDGQKHYVEPLDIRVAPGERIGAVGNNGQSDGPHLHISVHRRPVRGTAPDLSFENGDSRPLAFTNVRIASHAAGINALGANPALHPISGQILPSYTLFAPNGCGMNPWAHAGKSEVVHVGTTAACFGEMYNAMIQAGFRPVRYDANPAGTSTRTSTVWRPADGTPWIFLHGLDAAGLQSAHNTYLGTGYRYLQLESYTVNGAARYATIFVKQPGAAQFAQAGMTQSTFSTVFNQQSSAGKAMVNLSAAVVNGVTYYTGLWVQANVGSYSVKTVRVADYQAEFDAQTAAGRRPVSLSGFEIGTTPYLNTIWYGAMTANWAAGHNMSASTARSAETTNVGAGRLARSLTEYNPGTYTYAAVWRATPDATVTSGPPPSTTSSDATFTFGASDPLATFECKLDAGAWTACTSPKSYGRLSAATHTFQVRARDFEGLLDPTPAQRVWAAGQRPATFTNPLDGATNVDLTKPFTWGGATSGVQAYQLRIGTTVGGADLLNTADLPGNQTSYGVEALPTGKTLFARISTRDSQGTWRSSDVSFTAALRQATFTNPKDRATNVDTTKPFTWGGASPGVQNYRLYVGTTQGSSDVVQSPVLPGRQTSYDVPALPVGTTLWARIRTLGSDGVWRLSDVSFTASMRPATFTNPLHGATNIDTTKPFTWGGASPGVKEYRLYIGGAPGEWDAFYSGVLPGTQTSVAVPALPTTGTLYARLETQGSDGVRRQRDISFTAAPRQATFTNPLEGAVNVDTTKPFTWAGASPGVKNYRVVIGTSKGAFDVFAGPLLPPTQSSYAVPALPTGKTLWARIRTLGADDVWRSHDVSFTAALRQATFINPFDRATNVNTTKPFTWGGGSPGVQSYRMYVGTTKGSSDLVQSPVLPGSQTSYAVPALPTGQTLWARIRTLGSDGVWKYSDVSFTAAPRQATFTNPLDGATNVDTTKPFTWAGASPGVQYYRLYVGTTQGSSDLVQTRYLPASQTSYEVPALPTGTTLWARIRTLSSDGVWRYHDVSFTAAPRS